MLQWLKTMLFGSQEDYKHLIEQGAILLDVRTTSEFNAGHPKGAVNVPLDAIDHKIAKIKNFKKPIVTCCVSGRRSGIAASKLKANGIEVYNGGSWTKYL
jgi:phage shock protein E